MPSRQTADHPRDVFQNMVLLPGVRCPNFTNAQIIGSLYPINQRYAHGAHLLRQHLPLRLDHLSVICAYKLAPFEENGFPLARRLRVQQVLVDIGGHNGFCLDVDKVLAPIRFELDGEIVVHAYIPQQLAKEGEAPVVCPPSCVSCPLNVWLVLGQLCGYVAVPAEVRGFLFGGGMIVEVCSGEATDIFVAHPLASLQIFRLFNA